MTLIWAPLASSSDFRWTVDKRVIKKLPNNPELQDVLRTINLNESPRAPWQTTNFRLVEEREMAYGHFYHWQQKVDDISVAGKGIRLWTNTEGKVIQVEGFLDDSRFAHSSSLRSKTRKAGKTRLSSKSSWLIAQKLVPEIKDARIRQVTTDRVIRDSKILDIIKVSADVGAHTIEVDVETGKLMKHDYRQYPQGEAHVHAPIPVNVFPFYEEFNGVSLEKEPAELEFLKKSFVASEVNPYIDFDASNYPDNKFSPSRAATAKGREQGFWSWNELNAEAARLNGQMPEVENSFANGLRLDGLYTSIRIHPEAFKQFNNFDIVPLYGTGYSYFIEGDDSSSYVNINPLSYGKSFYSAAELSQADSTRDPQHDAEAYANAGFDEIQVYVAVNRTFEALQAMGFTDPELSTRPFTSILFNPDISMRNNAFYVNDTINFTTYDSDAQNYARDSLTIWHELGHGIMDRLMADVQLTDSGGLSEGMADFVAELIVRYYTLHPKFPGHDERRIINNVGFNLTNESHDDGEAYGGVLKDLLDAAVEKHGQAGVRMIADMTMEAMRLARSHPGLDGQGWLDRLLYADQLGRKGLREPGQFKELIQAAYKSRNYRTPGGAKFNIVWAKSSLEMIDITSESQGSRYNPIAVKSNETDSHSWPIKISVKDSGFYSFKFPLMVKVRFEGAPLQGAIHWAGEDQSDFQTLYLNNEYEEQLFDARIQATCERYNKPGKTCSDYLYFELFNDGDSKPVAKKRFYLSLSED